jgi:acyl-CoA synthetase (AMP-forming)/AMP-acid ligase II
MLDWWGPVIHEFYGATEGIGFCAIGPDEWLSHPGSVGRAVGRAVSIRDEAGRALPTGETGLVYFEAAAGPEDKGFEYLNAPDQTAAAFDREGRATVGDMGYLDRDGYLYLTGRAHDTIISGGVNIYPREIELALETHPAVREAAAFGIPDSGFGERAVAAVVARDGIQADEALARDLIAHSRSRLAAYKCPRAIRFAESLPRSPTGKLLRRVLRDRAG